MGLFDNYVSGLGLGGPPQPVGLNALLGGGFAGYSPGYGYAGQQQQAREQQARHFTMPMGLGAYFGQQQQQQGWQQTIPKVKHVDSREVTPREMARKQINGAVQAVKDAQNRAKT